MKVENKNTLSSSPQSVPIIFLLKIPRKINTAAFFAMQIRPSTSFCITTQYICFSYSFFCQRKHKRQTKSSTHNSFILLHWWQRFAPRYVLPTTIFYANSWHVIDTPHSALSCMISLMLKRSKEHIKSTESKVKKKKNKNLG